MPWPPLPAPGCRDPGASVPRLPDAPDFFPGLAEPPVGQGNPFGSQRCPLCHQVPEARSVGPPRGRRSSGQAPCLEAEGTGTQSGHLCLSFGARAFSAPVTYGRLAELSVSSASPRSGHRTGLLPEQRALDHEATHREARGLTSKWGRNDFGVSTPPSPVCARQASRRGRRAG